MLHEWTSGDYYLLAAIMLGMYALWALSCYFIDKATVYLLRREEKLLRQALNRKEGKRWRLRP